MLAEGARVSSGNLCANLVVKRLLLRGLGVSLKVLAGVTFRWRIGNSQMA
jgi:hypothetical protein